VQASGDIDPVTKDVIALHNDVANVDADAEGNAQVLGYTGGAFSHRRLQLDSTTHGVDYARELQQQAITGSLDDAAAVASNGWVHLSLLKNVFGQATDDSNRQFFVGRIELRARLGRIGGVRL